MCKIELPPHILTICDVLEGAGYEAYVVGGGVRDALIKRAPSDFDVATNALPQDVMALFLQTVPTGIKHGTVTVVLEDMTAEVTTFRKDGAYLDARRPDAVQFLPTIEGDLSRRDFTINAMAYHPKKGLLDIYGGQADLERRVIRTVGDARTRFSEDALRILRCYRFAAQLDFTIDAETKLVADGMAHLLGKVSRERIYMELSKTLSAANCQHLCAMEKVLEIVLPEALPLSEEKCAKVAARSGMAAKWASLCGKNTAAALQNVKAPRTLCLAATELALYQKGHSVMTDVAALRYNTAETLSDYMQCEAILKTYQKAVADGMPRNYKELAIGGDTLLKMGYKGREIRNILELLFMYVTDNLVNNKEDSLKEACKSLCKKEILPKA